MPITFRLQGHFIGYETAGRTRRAAHIRVGASLLRRDPIDIEIISVKGHERELAASVPAASRSQ